MPHALIIDDNARNLEVLAALLNAQGLDVTSVKDPTRAITEIQKIEHLDIIFCDLEMPKMDGYGLLPQLRQQVGPMVPIIGCSVHVSEIDTARRLGFSGFIGKPLDADSFPRQLERILNAKPVWDLP